MMRDPFSDDSVPDQEVGRSNPLAQLLPLSYRLTLRLLRALNRAVQIVYIEKIPGAVGPHLKLDGPQCRN